MYGDNDSDDDKKKKLENLISGIKNNDYASVEIRNISILRPEWSEGELAMLAESLFGNTSVKDMLVDASFGDGVAIAFAAALPHSALKYFSLCGDKIGDKGLEAIAKVLPTCPVTLESLLVETSYGSFTPEGVKALAEGVSLSTLQNFTLKIIDKGDDIKKEAETMTMLLSSALEKSRAARALALKHAGEQNASAATPAQPKKKPNRCC